MNVYITGGCKNGKSTFALNAAISLSAGRPMYYVATMSPSDDEDVDRIRRHRSERKGLGFATLEIYTGIQQCIDKVPCESVLLIDSITALMANEMFGSGRADGSACVRVTEGLEFVLSRTKDIVMVSDYIYSNAELFNGHTDMYMSALAAVDRRMAQLCDAVIELCNGCATFHKGTLTSLIQEGTV